MVVPKTGHLSCRLWRPIREWNIIGQTDCYKPVSAGA
jgi:hypothetical protein